jgi:translation initiation factor 1
MAKKESWKGREGIVYSTLEDFAYQNRKKVESSQAPLKQDLRVWLDKKSRAGKKVTLVKGFKGNPDHLKSIATLLKSKCGVGGTAKDGEILIQGDFRDKVVEILQQEGYKAKIAGG